MQSINNIKRSVACLCTLSTFGITQAMSVAAHAPNPNKAANQALNAEIKAAPKYHGKVVSVDTTKGTITIQQKKDAPQTFNVSSTTKIKLDKAKSTLADIMPGDHAVVRSDDKITALEIVAHDKNAPVATPSPAPTP